MRLVADVNAGFNQQEDGTFLRTLAIKFDFTSAFNLLDHDGLLDIMDDVGIPPCFGRFYRGFLQNRRFRVRVGNAVSHLVREANGSPQGTVSSPWPFIIYMEAMFRKISPG